MGLTSVSTIRLRSETLFTTISEHLCKENVTSSIDLDQVSALLRQYPVGLLDILGQGARRQLGDPVDVGALVSGVLLGVAQETDAKFARAAVHLDRLVPMRRAVFRSAARRWRERRPGGALRRHAAETRRRDADDGHGPDRSLAVDATVSDRDNLRRESP